MREQKKKTGRDRQTDGQRGYRKRQRERERGVRNNQGETERGEIEKGMREKEKWGDTNIKR